MDISWDNSESILLANPNYTKEQMTRFQSILEDKKSWPGHLWLSTSGSSVQKWVGLSKRALIISAEAINRHLMSDRNDIWIHALPNFHVGGLGIWTRAFLSGAKVCDFKNTSTNKWQVDKFCDYTDDMKGTLASLVPTQIYDLVATHRHAPPSLRAIIVGGGALPPDLYHRAVELGWPLLPSYGLTECSSQVATASLERCKKGELPQLELLTHFKGRILDGHLCFFGPSLLSTYATFDENKLKFIDPKVDGWFVSEDRGTIDNGILLNTGRSDLVVKIVGENVDIVQLEMLLQSLVLQYRLESEATLIALPDSRLDHCLCLVTNDCDQNEIAILVEHFQARVLPFEKIRKICIIEKIPRSALGKVLKQELKDQVEQKLFFGLVQNLF